MKKLFSLLMILGVMALGFNINAQDANADGAAGDTAAVQATPDPIPETPDYSSELPAEDDETFTQQIKAKFIEGDPGFMALPDPYGD